MNEEKLRCPITGMLMYDPVTLCDGYNYEREAINKWLKINNKSPRTNKPLSSKVVTPNNNMKESVQKFLQANPALFEDLFLPIEEIIQTCKANDITKFINIINNDNRHLTHDYDDTTAGCVPNKSKTLLHLVCEYASNANFVDQVLSYVEKHLQGSPEAILSKTTQHGWYPLHFAIHAGNDGVVFFLGNLWMKYKLSQTTSCTLKTSPNNMTYYLMKASKEGHADTVALLLDMGAQIESKDPESSSTPLILASSLGRKEVVHLLLSKPIDINATNKNRASALMSACANGHRDIAELLLRANADCSLVDQFGRTALVIASQQNHKNVVEVLLQYFKANLDAVDNIHGFSALLWACNSGHKEVAELLLDFGANFNLTSKKGETLFDVTKGSQLANFIREKIHSLTFDDKENHVNSSSQLSRTRKNSFSVTQQ